MLSNLSAFLERYFFHDPLEEPYLHPATRWAKDNNLLFALAVILFFAGAGSAIWAAPGHFAGALMLCFAFFGASPSVGFLFGVPKSTSETTDSKEDQTTRATLAVNTNLEQISDWITKIIVGLGLVELKQLPGYIDHLIAYVSRRSGACPTRNQSARTYLCTFRAWGFSAATWARGCSSPA